MRWSGCEHCNYGAGTPWYCSFHLLLPTCRANNFELLTLWLTQDLQEYLPLLSMYVTAALAAATFSNSRQIPCWPFASASLQLQPYSAVSYDYSSPASTCCVWTVYEDRYGVYLAHIHLSQVLIFIPNLSPHLQARAWNVKKKMLTFKQSSPTCFSWYVNAKMSQKKPEPSFSLQRTSFIGSSMPGLFWRASFWNSVGWCHSNHHWSQSHLDRQKSVHYMVFN